LQALLGRTGFRNVLLQGCEVFSMIFQHNFAHKENAAAGYHNEQFSGSLDRSILVLELVRPDKKRYGQPAANNNHRDAHRKGPHKSCQGDDYEKYAPDAGDPGLRMSENPVLGQRRSYAVAHSDRACAGTPHASGKGLPVAQWNPGSFLSQCHPVPTAQYHLRGILQVSQEHGLHGLRKARILHRNIQFEVPHPACNVQIRRTHPCPK